MNVRSGTLSGRRPGTSPKPTSDLHHRYNAFMVLPDIGSLEIARVFSPAQAVDILHSLGLEDLTECALLTRAYRRQVPFHRNGRKIIFTVGDLREIVEGQPQRPEPRARASTPEPAPAVPRQRRRSVTKLPGGPWRARRALDA